MIRWLTDSRIDYVYRSGKVKIIDPNLVLYFTGPVDID